MAPRRRRLGSLAKVVLVVLVSLLGGQDVLAAGFGQEGHWADRYLAIGMARDVLQGYSDGAIRPDDLITRAEFAAIVCRVMGEEENAEMARRLQPVFPDVPGAHWASGYFRVCFEAGIVLGDEQGLAWPERDITRAELVTITHRLVDYLQLVGPAVQERTFGDEDAIPEWARTAVAQMTGMGLVAGDENGLFRPNDSATRAESVVVAVRVLDSGGSTWDLDATVASADAEIGVVELIAAGGTAVKVRLDSKTAFFWGSERTYVGTLAKGAEVNVILSRTNPGVVAVVGVQQ